MKNVLFVLPRQTFRTLVATLVCTLVACPPQTMSAFAAELKRTPEESADYPGSLGKKTLTPPTTVTDFIDDLENDRLGTRAVKDADIMHLSGQSVEIFDHGKTRAYDLNLKNVEIPHVAFTGLKIVHDRLNNALMFEAFRGLNKNGENGILVARQMIRDVDIVTSAQDAEFFQFVDSKMRMHVIDLGMVALELFKSPIPIFQKIWEPEPEVEKQWAEKIASGTIKSGFLTRGTRPMNLLSAVVTPHDHEGKVRLNAGDFYLSYKDGTQENRAIAIFARETTYAQILRGYQTLQWQAALLSTDTTIQNQVENVINQVQGELDRQEINLKNEKMSPQARVVISSLDVGTLKSLESRRAATKSLQSNAFDQFNEVDWLSTFSDISANMPQETTDRAAEERWFQYIKQVNEKNVEAKHAATKTSEKEVTISKLKSIRKALSSNKGLLSIASILGITYTGFPFAHDHIEAIQQIKVLAWSYEAFYPAILKDAVYRIPLLLSIASLAALWPAGVGFSAVVGKTLVKMAEKVQGETSRKAIYIKDLAKNWGNLNNWQRVTSFGMRLYAWMILPYWRVLIEHILQQKTFFSAVNNGLNPLQKLLSDSEMGKKLGLTEDQRFGLNQIFDLRGGEAKSAKIDLNLKMQGAVVQENRKLDSIALLVAATLVAEKHKMDPALLMMLGNESADGLQLDKISLLLDTPERRKEWQMLSHLLIKEMSSLKRQSIVVDQNMSDLISKYYLAGEKIAKKIDTSSELRKKVEQFRMAFSSQLSNKLIAAANFAVADHVFLKNVYTNEFVSDQVYKEFGVDHLMVVGIVALYGERADLSHPEHLAADPNGFLWTSKAHWYDIFQNTFAHFFLSGAQLALVFQKIKPRVAANYAPIEDYTFVSRPREQGLWAATKAWTAVFNPIKSDLGGIIIKRFAKRFTTMTAGITMMAILRVGIWDQPVQVALLAWSFSFITAQWFFGWIWDPVQRGNEMEGERLLEAENRLKVARRDINRGDLERGRKEIVDLYEKYNPQVLKLFDLSQMSRNELLILSVDQPPIFTHANKWLSWITTWTAAVGSTVLSIPLSVILMDEKLLRAPETYLTWIPISVALYTASYFLSAKYAVKYRDYFAALKTKWLDRAEIKASKSFNPRVVIRGQTKCAALFVPAAG